MHTPIPGVICGRGAHLTPAPRAVRRFGFVEGRCFRAIVLAVLFLLAVGRSRAESPEIRRSSFTFPDAVVCTGGSVPTTWCNPWKVWARENPADPKYTFRGSVQEQGGAEVSWRLVGKTEHGDVYLLIFSRPGERPEKVPVLFNGEDVVSASVFGATLEIKPVADEQR